MASRQFKHEDGPTPGNQVATTRSFLDLSTEVLVQILAHLPPTDMIVVQRTCRMIRDIVDGTAYLQYILRTQIKGIEDSLPHDFPYSERLALLRRHEQSWSSLQFNFFTKSAITVSPRDSFTLQGGYLIHVSSSPRGNWINYGYTDLYSAASNEELRWVHVKMEHCGLPVMSEVIFSVDHDLVVAMRFDVISGPFLHPKNLTTHSKQLDSSDGVPVQFGFFEFTTGAPHPLAATHIQSLPLASGPHFTKIRMQVLGDHVLISEWSPSVVTFFLFSWKTGVVTSVSVLRKPCISLTHAVL